MFRQQIPDTFEALKKNRNADKFRNTKSSNERYNTYD